MVSDKIEALLYEFKNKYGYELVKDNYEKCSYLVFQREIEGNDHRLILENHRDEDWLILSELIDDERDWFGSYINTPYPLTYGEYKTIEQIIVEFERKEKFL